MAGVSLLWAVIVGSMMMAYGTLGVQVDVGGSAGWSLPSMANVNYSSWAASQTFVMGDVLYFNYSKEYHNVMEVKREDYEACSSNDPLSMFDDGETLIPLNRSGTFYFFCGVPSHCTAGQKMVVKVRKHALSSNATSQPSIFTPTPLSSPSPSSTPLGIGTNNNNVAPPNHYSLGTLILAFFYLFYGDSIFAH